MEGTIIRLDRAGKRRLFKRLRKVRDAALRVCCSIVLSRADGQSARDTAATLGICANTVRRIVKRFLEHGGAGPIDRHEENGSSKLGEAFFKTLYDVVAGSPLSHGWKRPTWTHEMRVATLKKLTGVIQQILQALRRTNVSASSPPSQFSKFITAERACNAEHVSVLR